MKYATIVSTETLADHLQDPDWCVIDSRFDLAHPGWGGAEYQKAHIPGAIFADLDRDLASPITPASGRHPLPLPDRWQSTVSQWGITPATQVVAYDSAGGSLAAVRVWWLLRAYGHSRVAVLDGGYPKWLSEHRPLETVLPPARPIIPFSGQLNPRFWVSVEDLIHLYRDSKVRLIDARAGERFRGEIEAIDPVAGHIPGALNRPYTQNLNPDQTFKSPAQLREDFGKLLGDIRPQNIIAYCGSGVTAGHNLLALEIAGLSGGKLYPGSWSEWIRDPERPIETGA
ncbi:rhodanese-related sulfurtransferase [Longilinea arvoryzae]|uniref:Rhodanese-related sulfurtransferase n=1 Tax=Longilinea arvoryzae TaxID=360412 RepID=A0A0S7BHE7_9CHLR|nr:sulfurtransferase [Longilinea arvoryzae]GAP14576.1 rhodanese-related sulfurtransferase [Longilinea arvoryzae]